MKRLFNQSIHASLARIVLAAAVIFAVGALSACGDDQLKTVASNLDRAALLVQNGREVRDELFAQGVIDRDDAYKVTLALQKVNNSLRAFNNRAQTYKDAGGLTPEGKALLKKLADDISSAATDLVSDGTFGVKSADAQARLNAIIGSIRQVTLAIVDAVDALKTKAPTQQAGFPPLAALPLLLLALRQIMEHAAAERARTGKTSEEVFTDVGVRVDANALALAGDLARYAPEGEVTAEVQAQVDALFASLTAEAK